MTNTAIGTSNHNEEDDHEWSLTSSIRTVRTGRGGGGGNDDQRDSTVSSSSIKWNNTIRKSTNEDATNTTERGSGVRATNSDDEQQLEFVKDFLFESLAPSTSPTSLTTTTPKKSYSSSPKKKQQRRESLYSSCSSSAASSSANIEVGSTIFESVFDLTEDRLRRLFHVFDEDKNGTISYEELKLGFAHHGVNGRASAEKTTAENNPITSLQMNDRAFQLLVEYLDADKSGQITFEEFSEGVRLLMLRNILQDVNNNNSISSGRSRVDEDSVLTQVFDYNGVRLERYLLKGDGQLDARTAQSRNKNDSFAYTTTTSKSLVDFFLEQREDTVTVRWINVTGRKASNIMKMMALKYRLHPLSLQDALEHTNHRPKADSYDHHYFIMVPVFYWKGNERKFRKESAAEKREERQGCWGRIFDTCRKKNTGGKRYDSDTDDDEENSMTDGDEYEERRDNQDNLIGMHMTSIFITKPCGRTVVTFNNELNNDDNCWHNLQSELRMDYSKLRQYDGQHLAYRLLDEAVDKIEDIVKKLKSVYKHERRAVIKNNYQNLNRMHALNSELQTMARKFKPFLRLLVHVIEDDSFSPGATVYLRDVLDNLEIHEEDLKNLIVKCEEVDVEAEKLQARQVDSTLYSLTVISAVFLPAQFLTGLWGMNFHDMPELHWDLGYELFWICAVTSVLITICFLTCRRYSHRRSPKSRKKKKLLLARRK